MPPRRALKEAAQRAQAAALDARTSGAVRPINPEDSSPRTVLLPPAIIEIDSSAESDCGYMDSVNVEISTDENGDENLIVIRKWEHRMHRWMEAYWEGLETWEAQIKVKRSSPTKHKSHRRVPESVAAAMDV